MIQRNSKPYVHRWFVRVAFVQSDFVVFHSGQRASLFPTIFRCYRVLFTLRWKNRVFGPKHFFVFKHDPAYRTPHSLGRNGRRETRARSIRNRYTIPEFPLETGGGRTRLREEKILIFPVRDRRHTRARSFATRYVRVFHSQQTVRPRNFSAHCPTTPAKTRNDNGNSFRNTKPRGTRVRPTTRYWQQCVLFTRPRRSPGALAGNAPCCCANTHLRISWDGKFLAHGKNWEEIVSFRPHLGVPVRFRPGGVRNDVRDSYESEIKT